MWFTYAHFSFLSLSLVNSTHHVQLNWQSNRTGMLCCFCALFSLLLLISATFLFALWVLSGVYCMWGAKGFLVGTPHHSHPPPNPPPEITPKKELQKRDWMKFIHIYTVWGWKAAASKRCVKCSKPSKIVHPTSLVLKLVFQMHVTGA
jgi:hypothetical protein